MPGPGCSKAPLVESGAADGHERAKDFLTEGEIMRLLDAASAGRHGMRDHLLPLKMFRHDLQVSETVALPSRSLGRLLRAPRSTTLDA